MGYYIICIKQCFKCMFKPVFERELSEISLNINLNQGLFLESVNKFSQY